MDDVHRTLGSHDGQFCRGPRHVVVARQVLAGHGEVGASVGLPGDQSHLWDRGFGIGVEEFCSVADDATPFLHHAREEAGNVFDGQQGEVERVAGANEPSGFDGRIDVQTTGEHLRLVGDDAHGATAKAGEADDDVLRVSVEELDKASVVDDRFDDLHHVVRLVRVVGTMDSKSSVSRSDGSAVSSKGGAASL